MAKEIDVKAALAAVLAEAEEAKAKAAKKAAKEAMLEQVHQAVQEFAAANPGVEIPDSLHEALVAKLMGQSGKHGVVPKKFYDRYVAQGGNNGDEFAVALRDAFVVEDKDGNESFRRASFEVWARSNGFWADKYDRLNDGMVRMNVGNRARAAIRRGKAVTIGDRVFGRRDIKPVK